MRYLTDLIKDKDKAKMIALLEKVQDPAVKAIIAILIKEPSATQRAIDDSTESIKETRKRTEEIKNRRGWFGFTTSV